VTAIWGLDDGRWRPLRPGEYPTEQALHDLVAQDPQMLPLSGAPRLTVLGTEVQLGQGRVDVLAVESSGRIAIIEVKLASNAEARRAVVAQVLSYAAHLQGLDLDYLESATLRSHLPWLGVDSVLDAVRKEDQAQSIDADHFAAALARNLAEGAFRLVIVLDSAPEELVQIAGYLEALSDKIVVDLVTVVPYDVDNSRVLVPQRVDPGKRAAELSAAEAAARTSRALYPGSEEFRTAAAAAPADQHDLLERLIGWAEQLASEGLVKLATFRGKNSITTLLPRLRGDDAGLVTVYQDPRAAYVQFWPTVFDRRAPESRSLVEEQLGAPIRHGERVQNVTDDLLRALTTAYREANGIGPAAPRSGHRLPATDRPGA
jgi:hypothetical protein